MKKPQLACDNLKHHKLVLSTLLEVTLKTQLIARIDKLAWDEHLTYMYVEKKHNQI